MMQGICPEKAVPWLDPASREMPCWQANAVYQLIPPRLLLDYVFGFETLHHTVSNLLLNATFAHHTQKQTGYIIPFIDTCRTFKIANSLVTIRLPVKYIGCNNI